MTNFFGGVCNNPTIQVAAGGKLLAPNLATITASLLSFAADGSNSLIDLSGLTYCSSPSDYLISFEASAGGSILMPLMSGGPLISVTINAGGAIPTAQLAQLYQLTLFAPANCNALTNLTQLTVNGATNSFPALVDFTEGNLSVNNGATVTMPALRNYAKLCYGANWTVSGANSLLSLPALTNITGQACYYPVIQAQAGGTILMTNLASILAGPLAFQADGADSLIDLSALASVSGQDPYQVTFEASGGGTIRIPHMSGGPFTGVLLNPGGIMDTAQIRKLASLTATVSIDFPALVDFTDGNITVNNGATVTMPAVQNYAKFCNGGYWTISGSNSVLNLPALTNITGQACNYPVIAAYDGGQVILSNVLSILAGPLGFQADGSNSVINLNRLTTCSGQSPYPVTFEASAGGTIEASNFVGGPMVGVIANPGGNLPLAQVRQLYSVTANNGAVATLAALTNLDDGTLSAETGGQIILPALQVVNPSTACNYSAWEANGSGSQIVAPALSAIVGSTCTYDYVQALAGGQIVLSNLASLNGQYIRVLADGTGSVIDLSHMSSFLSVTPASASLTAQNNGVILLGTQAFLLQNININIPAGNPLLPPMTNTGPNLTLYGVAGHSYLIEQLNTTIPSANWQYFLRVPLTNALQEISAGPPPNIAFRITDFVADPPLLDLLKVPIQNVEVVLYGATNKTYELDSAPSLDSPPPWTSNAVAVMTNAFRIFAPVAPTGPENFFRAKQIAP